jgi:hypothetical protein
MSQIILLCIFLYLIVALPVMFLIWASLVVAKDDDAMRSYDLLEGQALYLES